MGRISGSKASTKKRRSSKSVDSEAPADHVISWFEIPAFNIERAMAFYGHVLGVTLERVDIDNYAMGMFPTTSGIGGAVIQGPGCMPTDQGTLVYLDAGEDLLEPLNRVQEAGGRVVLGKTQISEDAGHFALIIDSEGNRLALHSRN